MNRFPQSIFIQFSGETNVYYSYTRSYNSFTIYLELFFLDFTLTRRYLTNVLTMICIPINFLHWSKSIPKREVNDPLPKQRNFYVIGWLVTIEKRYSNKWLIISTTWRIEFSITVTPFRFNSRSTWQPRGHGNTRVRSKLVTEARLGMVGVSISHQAFQWRY